ncbi:MAG: bacteriohemerythrin [Syntrophales bacterium]
MEHMISDSPDNKIQRVEWTSNLSMHVAKLDAQHQKLFAITNNLIELYEKRSDELLNVLEDLVQYTSDHFRDETHLMFETRYTGLEEQKQMHDQFIDKVSIFIKEYSKGKEQLTYDMLNYSRNWLYMHTSEEDLKFARYLVKTGLKDKYWNR